MLVNSKTNNDKVVLGLLSLTFPEDERDLSNVKELLESIYQDDSQEIFLYRDPETDNFIGIFVVEFNTLESNDQRHSTSIVIQRYGIVPSFIDDGIDYRMYGELRKKYPNYASIGTMDLSEKVAQWGEKFQQEALGE